MFALIRLAVGVGLIVYLARSGEIHIRDLERLYIAWPLTLAAFALILLHLAAQSWRLSLLFRPHDLKLTFRAAMRLSLIGLFFDMFMPGSMGGTVAKLYYTARENEGRRTQIATVVLLDRIMGLFSLFVLPLIFAPAFLGIVSRVRTLRAILTIFSAIALFLVAVLLACLGGQSLVDRLARALPFSPARNIASRAMETIAVYRKSVETLLYTFGLSLFGNLSIVGVIAMGLLVVRPASVAWRLGLIVPVGQIVNSLPITPGGLGVGEIAFHTLFRLTGLAGGVEAVLCWRIWAALVGCAGLVFYLLGMEPNILEAESFSTPETLSPAGERQHSDSRGEWRQSRESVSAMRNAGPIPNDKAARAIFRASGPN